MPRAHKPQRNALAVGCSAHATQDGLGAATYVLLPILAQTFGLSYAQVGFFEGVKNLAQALLELISGMVSEHFGAGLTLIFGLVLAGLGYALLSGAEQSAFLLLCLLVIGIGNAFQHAPASALVTEAYPAEGRRAALGLYNAAGDVGKLAFTGCFSLAIGVGLAWQQIAFSYGMAALVVAGVIGLLLPTLQHTKIPKPIEKTREVKSEVSTSWGILNRRSFAKLLMVISLDNMVQAGVLVFVAFAMIDKNLPLYIATMAAVVVLVGGVFGKAGCGYLAQHLGPKKSFVLVQLATVVGLLLLVFSPAWVAFGILLPLGVVSQGSTSITYGLVPDLIHKDRIARGYALMYSLTSFAAALGPFLFGLIGDSFGINNAFFAMAAVCAISWVPLLRFPVSEKA